MAAWRRRVGQPGSVARASRIGESEPVLTVVQPAEEGRPAGRRLEAAHGGVLCPNVLGVLTGLLRAPDKRPPLPGAEIHGFPPPRERFRSFGTRKQRFAIAGSLGRNAGVSGD